jgi:diaminopropionate ammonia-lyase
MTTPHPPPETPEIIAATLRRLSPGYEATPLIDLPKLAAHLGVGGVLAKNEGQRMLGSFKSLGGTYAALRALARAAGTDIAGMLATAKASAGRPTLLCASDGNHGLAVAAAARLAGGAARVFLHGGVPPLRAERIAAQGAEIVWVNGTYDDAVDAAHAAAGAGQGILIADTSDDASDPVVADVMAGYGVMAWEIMRQVEDAAHPRPTHLFVQAGVGGLAAAMVEALKPWLAPPAAVIVTEPEAAACIAASLATDPPPRVPGGLDTVADMLACGQASAVAMPMLRRHSARVVTLSEAALAAAPRLLSEQGGPATTPSGAAGLAALAALMANPRDAAGYGLSADSRVLILVTEAALDGQAT